MKTLIKTGSGLFTFTLGLAIALTAIANPAIVQTAIYGGQGDAYLPRTVAGQFPQPAAHSDGYPQYQQPSILNPARQTFPSPQPSSEPHASLPPTQLSVDSPTQRTDVNVPWYQNLAIDRHHDFGIVPTASKQQHVFEFENTSGSDLVLASVRASCGCTKPEILTTIVAPGQMAKVSAILDTLKFHGKKGATVTVSVKRMGSIVEWGELQFSVKGRIRQDVVLNPGEVNFRNVIQGVGKELVVDLVYAGNPAWAITDIKSTTPSITAVAREVRRDDQLRQTTYQVVVKLATSQGIGTFNEYLSIVTNDPKTSGMPIHVQGRVRRGIEVSPVRLGDVTQNQSIGKRLIVKSDIPVAVLSIQAGESPCRFSTPTGTKRLHIIDYEFDTSITGSFSDEIVIRTSSVDQPEIRVPFSVKVVPYAIADN